MDTLRTWKKIAFTDGGLFVAAIAWLLFGLSLKLFVL